MSVCLDIVVSGYDEVFHGDLQSFSQAANGFDGAGFAAGFDIGDLHAVDAGRDGKGGLGKLAVFPIDAKRAFAGQHAVNQGGWNKFFLARGYGCLDTRGGSNVGQVLCGLDKAFIFVASDGHGFG